jgi:hypothetical protein
MTMDIKLFWVADLVILTYKEDGPISCFLNHNSSTHMLAFGHLNRDKIIVFARSCPETQTPRGQVQFPMIENNLGDQSISTNLR